MCANTWNYNFKQTIQMENYWMEGELGFSITIKNLYIYLS